MWKVVRTGGVRRGWLLLMPVALLAAACGGDDGTAPPGSGAASESNGTSGEADPDGVIRIGADLTERGGTQLDPIRYSTQPLMATYTALVYDTMLRQNPDGGFEPGLATEWETPDDQTIVLTLREGVEFHDGTPFNAEAVKIAWDRVINDKNVTKNASIAAMQSVEVLGDHQVQVKLKTPTAGLFLDQALSYAEVLGVPSPTALAAQGPMDHDPVGAGPFQVTEYLKDQSIVLEAWDGYWDAENIRAAGWEFVHVPPGQGAIAAFRTGAVDLMTAPPTLHDELDAIDGVSLENSTEKGAPPSMVGLNLCTKKPPFDTLEARQALGYALNREQIIDVYTGGAGEPLQNMVSPAQPFYEEDYATPYEYDPERARELLAQAGVPEGTEVLLLHPTLTNVTAAAELVKAQLAEVGLEVVLNPNPNPSSVTRQLQPNISMSSIPQTTMATFVTPGGVVNVCDDGSPELLQAIQDTQRAVGGDQARNEAWARVQELWTDDASRIIVGDTVQYIARTDEVAGIEVHYPSNRGVVPFTLYKVA